MIGGFNILPTLLSQIYIRRFYCLVLLPCCVCSVMHAQIFSKVRRVCVVQLKSKWNSLSWIKKKRWTGCRLTAKRVPLLTADRTGPSVTAPTTTPPSSPSTTNHGTMWRPPSVTLRIWKTDSKKINNDFFFHTRMQRYMNVDQTEEKTKTSEWNEARGSKRM